MQSAQALSEMKSVHDGDGTDAETRHARAGPSRCPQAAPAVPESRNTQANTTESNLPHRRGSLAPKRQIGNASRRGALKALPTLKELNALPKCMPSLPQGMPSPEHVALQQNPSALGLQLTPGAVPIQLASMPLPSPGAVAKLMEEPQVDRCTRCSRNTSRMGEPQSDRYTRCSRNTSRMEEPQNDLNTRCSRHMNHVFL